VLIPTRQLLQDSSQTRSNILVHLLLYSIGIYLTITTTKHVFYHSHFLYSTTSMFTAHESHQTLPPISKPGRTSFQAFPRAPKRELTSKISTLFLISNFPPELRNELYAHYFASLQPLRITSENVSSPLHKETQLSLSSPFFESDIWPKYLLLELYFLILKSDDSQAICPRRRKRQSC
jgi:hypothetical protein